MSSDLTLAILRSAVLGVLLPLPLPPLALPCNGCISIDSLLRLVVPVLQSVEPAEFKQANRSFWDGTYLDFRSAFFNPLTSLLSLSTIRFEALLSLLSPWLLLLMLLCVLCTFEL